MHGSAYSYQLCLFEKPGLWPRKWTDGDVGAAGVQELRDTAARLKDAFERRKAQIVEDCQAEKVRAVLLFLQAHHEHG